MAGDNDPIRVDFHHHFVPPVYRKSAESVGVGGVGGIAFPPWSEDSMYANMDRRGIRKALLSISAPGVTFLEGKRAAEIARAGNDAAAELREKNRARIGCFTTLPLPDIDASLAELERTEKLGFDGVTLLSNYRDVYLSDPRLDPVLAELDRQNALVFVHPHVPAGAMNLPMYVEPPVTEFTFDTTRVMFDLILRGQIDKYPHIRWVLAHFGGTLPFLAGRLRTVEHSGRDRFSEFRSRGRPVLDYIRSFYYDSAMSSTPINIRALTELVGADHLVYGSDSPHAPEMMVTLNTADVDAIADAEAKDALNFGNAERLLKGLR